MKTIWAWPAMAGALMLGGCFGGVTGAEAGKALKVASDKAAATLDDAASDLTHTQRIRYAYRISWQTRANMQPPSDAAINKAFSEFACQGIGAYARERAAMDTLSQFNTTIAELMAPPSDDFGDLLVSIGQYEAGVDGLSAPNPDATDIMAYNKCINDTQKVLAKVTGDDGNLLQSRVGRAANQRMMMDLVGTSTVAIEAVDALVDGLKALAKLMLQEADIAARQKALRGYLKDEKTIEALKAVLGDCIDHKKSIKYNGAEWIDEKKDEFTACMGKPVTKQVPLSNESLQTIMDERRDYAVIVPYITFRQLYVSYNEAATLNLMSTSLWAKADAMGPRRDAESDRFKQREIDVEIAKLRKESVDMTSASVKKGAGGMATAEEAHKQLASFDGLRLKRVPKTMHRDLVDAVVDLRRIANNELTPQEWKRETFAVIKRVAALLDNAKVALKDTREDMENLKRALADLRAALAG